MTHRLLLERAGLLLAEPDAINDLLAVAACRMAVETHLRSVAEPLLRHPLRNGSLSLFATVLCSRGVLTTAERNALKRAARIASRAMHTACTTADDAERLVDFGVEIVRRLERRL